MKKFFLYPVVLLVSGCLSAKVAPDTPDPAFAYQQTNGQISLTSTSSAMQTKIIRQQQIGDTLFITYRKGAFLKPSSIVPLTAQTHYLQCAGRRYKVAKTASGFQLDETQAASR
ncbi:hypothetical protein [Hymenobacter lucidus]|uniref:Lipoprotein n=1 Tax=Hymenobacter lucidus TaxID=2880930 RepID=A0ABS8AP87_9BACT|nr:hypothetical protein [Hymenobacter lucidus]MCB2406551.1 hypothetical protein [Hymenobacter lucidus]